MQYGNESLVNRSKQLNIQINMFEIEKSKFQHRQNMGKTVVTSALQSMRLCWKGSKEISMKYFEGPIYC